MQDKTTIQASVENVNTEDNYEAYLNVLASSIYGLSKNYHLFHSDVKNRHNSRTILWDTFLANIPEERRQHYNCNTCKNFVVKFGDLVFIDPETNRTMPAVFTEKPYYWDETYSTILQKESATWENVCPVLSTAMVACYELVKSSVPISKFSLVIDPNESYGIIGTPDTGDFHHMYGMIDKTNASLNYEAVHYSENQDYIRAINEAFKIVKNAMEKYSLQVFERANQYIANDILSRSEKYKAQMKSVYDLKKKIDGIKNVRIVNNIIWQYVVENLGFAHISSTMVGFLMDEISKLKSPDEIKKSWEEKVSPENYMRPKAAPTEGAVNEAEKLIVSLGLENSLQRRFATFNDLQKIWVPNNVTTQETEEETKGGVFSSVITKEVIQQKQEMDLIPPVEGELRLTMHKFLEKLPSIVSMRLQFSNYINMVARHPFVFTLTEKYQGAKPILAYDDPSDRNPVSWYAYPNGITANEANCNKSVNNVIGIMEYPCYWNKELNIVADFKGYIFLLENCYDKNYKNVGMGLFPEILIPELRPIRSTIEAFSNANHPYMPENVEDVYGSGGVIFDGSTVMRVTAKHADGTIIDYAIDMLE